MKTSKVSKMMMAAIALGGGMGSVTAASAQGARPTGSYNSAATDCVNMTDANAFATRTQGGQVQALKGYDSVVVFNYNPYQDSPRSGAYLDIMAPDMSAPIVSVERDGTVRDYARGVVCKAGSQEAQTYLKYLKDDMHTYVEELKDREYYKNFIGVRVNRILDHVAARLIVGNRKTTLGEHALRTLSGIGFDAARQQAQLRRSAIIGETNMTATRAAAFIMAASATGSYARDAQRLNQRLQDREAASQDRLEQSRQERCERAARNGHTPAFCR